MLVTARRVSFELCARVSLFSDLQQRRLQFWLDDDFF